MCSKMIISLLPLFFTLNLLAQEPVKQITYYSSDVKNANYIKTVFLDSLLLYEVYNGNSVNIHCRVYNSLSDSFYIFPPLTDDQFTNINPLGIASYSYPIVFYQTNRNGNWDIVYRKWTSEGWSDTFDLLATPENEEEPKYLGRTLGVDTVYLVCRQGNKILLLSFKDGLTSQETIFTGDEYGQNNYYTGLYSPYLEKSIHIAATEQTAYGSRIVYKYKSNGTGWTLPLIAADSGNFARPLFFDFLYDPYLFYENEENGNSQIFYRYLDTGIVKIVQPDITGDKSELDISPPLAIVGEQLDDYLPLLVYKLGQNDSLFIRTPINEVEYESLPIRTVYPDPAIAPLGIIQNYLVYYSFWEDSINGTIQLFGKRFLILLGDVSDNSSVEGYSLYQNYPNPFNPVTTISYSLNVRAKVRLTIMNLLGEEISLLLNEEQESGNHQVKFDGSGLSSGVYFYQLKALPIGRQALPTGRQALEFVSTKKMILLK